MLHGRPWIVLTKWDVDYSRKVPKRHFFFPTIIEKFAKFKVSCCSSDICVNVVVREFDIFVGALTGDDGCSVTRLGDFWKFVGTKFLAKVAKKFATILGLLWKMAFLYKTDVDTFWASFGENWTTFYSNIWSHWTEVQFLTWLWTVFCSFQKKATDPLYNFFIDRFFHQFEIELILFR